jgi:hypothetical protein
VPAAGSPILSNPTVSKLPYGLLGFLGVKNGGAYPGFLGDTFVPTINETYFQLCLASWGEEFHIANGATAAGPGAFQAFNTALVVPLGEVWYVGMLSVRITTGAGETITTNIAIRRPNAAAGSNHIAVSDPVSVVASQFADLRCPRPFFAGNGDEIGMWIQAASGAGPLVRPDIRFLRMPT